MRGDSRTDHHDVGGCDPIEVVGSQLDVGSQLFEVGCTSCSRGISAEIRDIGVVSLNEGQSSGGISAAPEAEDCDGHRIFSVEMATMAERIPRIQNRMTTVVSAHPSFSKW